jgi:hypothetical protein
MIAKREYDDDDGEDDSGVTGVNTFFFGQRVGEEKEDRCKVNHVYETRERPKLTHAQTQRL